MPRSPSPWSQKFDEPIVLPDGRELVTLRDAGNYMASMPAAVHSRAEWVVATEALLLVAERGGPTMLARIAVQRALNHRKSPAKPTRRKRAKVIIR
jgi:hypothetical protein